VTRAHGPLSPAADAFIELLKASAAD
jgi:hypothetical protein